MLLLQILISPKWDNSPIYFLAHSNAIITLTASWWICGTIPDRKAFFVSVLNDPISISQKDRQICLFFSLQYHEKMKDLLCLKLLAR